MHGENTESDDPNYCKLADVGVDMIHMATDGQQWKCGHLKSRVSCMVLQI